MLITPQPGTETRQSSLQGAVQDLGVRLEDARTQFGRLEETIGTESLGGALGELRSRLDAAGEQLTQVGALAGEGATPLTLIHDYMGVFVVAFVVTLLATPVMRRLAVSHGIVDRPGEARKLHRIPVAYLGGVAVYLGLLMALLFSYTEPMNPLITFHPSKHVDMSWLPNGVPVSILLGMTVIMLIGLWDDVVGIDPRAKIAGQLFAAGALAMEDVGVKVAAGFIAPIIRTVLGDPSINELGFNLPLFGMLGHEAVYIDLIYWSGTAIIAVFVLGACNASNLIDGLDGLLTGTTAICAAGLLLIALGMAVADDGTRDASRIVLCLALLGACLGFLPHNFNPANIFLGDCGSMLLGYCTIVIILTLGDTGKTHYVIAGLLVYAIPIIDTTLAIFRRKIAGKKISQADDDHLHHLLKRTLGVKGAVLTLYAIGIGFAALGVLLTRERGRMTYALALIVAAFIGVIALKTARRQAIEREAIEKTNRSETPAPDHTDEGNGRAARPALSTASADPAPAGAAEKG